MTEGKTISEEAEFEGGLLPLCPEIFSLCPFSRPVSRNGKIGVWVSSVGEAETKLQIKTLRGINITAVCRELNQNWARISRVDRGFTDDDIRTALASAGVTEARRETTKRKIDGELVTVKTDGVLLKIAGIPPTEVTLAGRSYKVVLHAGTPISCYLCQKLGHMAAACNSSAAFRRCGSFSYLVADCKNQPKCVNCRGAHLSSSPQCPLRACETERRKVIMENRILQQLRATHPTATIETVSTPEVVAVTPAAGKPDVRETTETTPKSYAAAVRKVVADTEIGGATAAKKEKLKRRTLLRKNTGKLKKMTNSGRGKGLKSLGDAIEPITKILDII